MSVAGPKGRPLETIWWNGAERIAELKSGIEMAYTIETSKWNGRDVFAVVGAGYEE